MSTTRPQGPVITVGGLHGVGKSTHSKALADSMGLRYVSTGLLFRDVAAEKGMDIIELTKLSAKDRSIDKEIDDRSKRLLMEGNVVFDSMLAPYLSLSGRVESFRIYLFAPLKVRTQRIADRDDIEESRALMETELRERTELERFKRYYSIDIRDTSIYHLMLDTSLFPIEDNVKILCSAVTTYIRRVWPDWHCCQ
ncbi:MAG TPA: cytidylate kinase family protein [Thermoproteota archaeon]|nr:cytidylate kinase family protein [Thermoproteota archaeon]